MPRYRVHITQWTKDFIFPAPIREDSRAVTECGVRKLLSLARVVPNQKEKFESDDLMKKHTREGEASDLTEAKAEGGLIISDAFIVKKCYFCRLDHCWLCDQ